MKLLLVLAAVVLGVTTARGQDFRVNAVSGEEKLSYAYVYINSRVFGVADADGVAVIPQKYLRPGDSISVSYVGAVTASVVYTAELAAKQGCTLDLAPNQVLDNVVVEGRFNTLKFFNRNVRKHPVLNWWQQIDGHAGVKLQTPAKTSSFDIDFYYGIIPTHDGRNETHMRTGFREYLCVEKTDSVAVYGGVFNVLWRAIDSPFLYERADMNAGMKIRYTGEKDGKRHFTLVRYSPETKDNYQLELVVDKETKEIESARLEVLFLPIRTQLSCTMLYRLQKLPYQNNQTPVVLCPSRVEGQMKFCNGTIMADVVLDKMKIRAYKQPEIDQLTDERDNRPPRETVIHRESLYEIE